MSELGKMELFSNSTQTHVQFEQEMKETDIQTPQDSDAVQMLFTFCCQINVESDRSVITPSSDALRGEMIRHSYILCESISLSQ